MSSRERVNPNQMFDTVYYEMGVQAYASKTPVTSCPFDENTWPKAEWINGWKWAEEQGLK